MSYDPKTSLIYWTSPDGTKSPMSRFGRNPYGENLYRVVRAPSRRYLVFGNWPDGSRKASWVEKYPEVGDSWILERWMTPFEYTRMTPEVWNQTMTILGPYPSRGEYEISHDFHAVHPTDANLEKLISWIEEGRKRSYWENRTACQDDFDREEKSTTNLKRDIISDSLPAFGVAAMTGFGGGRGTKTARDLKTAEEVGLPTKAGMTRVQRSNQQFEVQVQI